MPLLNFNVSSAIPSRRAVGAIFAAGTLIGATASLALTTSNESVAGPLRPAGASPSERALAWERARPTPSRREVRILYYKGPGEYLTRAVLRQRARTITITLYAGDRGTAGDSAVPRCIEIPLNTFVGRRTVIDGKTGRSPRPDSAFERNYRFRRSDCPQPKRLQRR